MVRGSEIMGVVRRGGTEVVASRGMRTKFGVRILYVCTHGQVSIQIIYYKQF